MKEIINNQGANNTGKITSVEIAELTGREHRHLMRSIRKMEESWVKLGQSKFGLSSYINSQNRAMPIYELSKTECLYIATKFNDEARAKLILRWQQLEEQKQLSPAEQLLQNAQLLVAQEKKLSEHDSRIKVLEAKTTTRPDYYTVAGFATLHNVQVNMTLARKIGIDASKLCKQHNYPVDKVTCVRYGYVNTYPSKVLSHVFYQYFPNKQR